MLRTRTFLYISWGFFGVCVGGGGGRLWVGLFVVVFLKLRLLHSVVVLFFRLFQKSILE